MGLIKFTGDIHINPELLEGFEYNSVTNRIDLYTLKVIHGFYPVHGEWMQFMNEVDGDYVHIVTNREPGRRIAIRRKSIRSVEFLADSIQIELTAMAVEIFVNREEYAEVRTKVLDACH